MSTSRGPRARRRGGASVEYALVAGMLGAALAGLASLGSGVTERLSTTSEVVDRAGRTGPGQGAPNNSASSSGARP